MSDAPHFHHWSHYPAPPNPSGVPVADRFQSNLLLKAIKTFSKVKTPRPRAKKPLISKDTIVIKHKKTRFW